MAREEYPPHPVRDVFLRELITFYRSCGKPSYGQLNKTSERLTEIYPNNPELHKLPILNKTALSNTFNGNRKGFPKPAWLACLVVCCQRLAFEAGIYTVDPGRATVPHWQKRLSMAEDEARRRGLPCRGPQGLAEEVPVEPFTPDPAVVFASLPPSGRRDNDLPPTGPARLTDGQRAYIDSYGGYGTVLLRRAQGRDPYAFYQAGLLLAAHPDMGEDALSLFTVSAAVKHPQSLALLQASPTQLDRDLAAAHATEMAKLAQQAAYPQAALALLECIVRFGETSSKPVINKATSKDQVAP